MKSKLTSKQLGAFGESLAAADYRREGYNVAGVNYNTRFGEIDLILEKDGEFVFSEVKTRRSAGFMYAKEAVDGSKQKKIISAAAEYADENNISDSPMRFDVVEVYVDEAGNSKVNRIENAFEL